MEILIILVVSFAFFLQRITGFGSAVIATPVLALLWEPHEAIALVLIFQNVFGLWLIRRVWRQLLDRRLVPFMILFFPAILLGTWLLPMMPADLVRKGLAAVCAFVMIEWLFLSKLHLPRKFQPAAGCASGLMSGLVQGSFGMGGPFFLLYYGSVEKRADLIRDSIIALFTVANLLRAPVAFATAQFTPDVLRLALFTAPLFVAAMIFGARLTEKVDAGLFRYLVIGILFLAAVQLVFQ
jgi:uncharacterized membrane protein YfcA